MATDKIGTHETRVYVNEAGVTCVTYHNTVVVSFNGECVHLRTGGYFTRTTKLRMNQASNQFRLGYRVYQKGFTWFVETSKGEILEMVGESMVFDRACTPDHPTAHFGLRVATA